MPTDQRHPLGVTDTPEPRSARQTINDMLDAGLLDELMDRVDAGELTLTGEGGFLPEMVKAVLERRAGLQAFFASVVVLPASFRAATIWGEIQAHARLRGRPRPVNDSWIAA